MKLGLHALVVMSITISLNGMVGKEKVPPLRLSEQVTRNIEVNFNEEPETTPREEKIAHRLALIEELTNLKNAPATELWDFFESQVGYAFTSLTPEQQNAFTKYYLPNKDSVHALLYIQHMQEHLEEQLEALEENKTSETIPKIPSGQLRNSSDA